MPARDLDLDDDAWTALSRDIRLHHECAHYFTRRVHGAVHASLLDELAADFMGISLAAGRYRAGWFLRFMGIDRCGTHAGGRMGNYVGEIPAGSAAFDVLRRLLIAAASNLELAERALARGRPHADPLPILIALIASSLEELAADPGAERLLAFIHALQPDGDPTA